MLLLELIFFNVGNNLIIIVFIQNSYKKYEANLHSCNGNEVHIKEKMTIDNNKSEGFSLFIILI